MTIERLAKGQHTGLAARSRKEHLDWCKARALQYVEAGDMSQAFASMASDLNNHPETQGHPATELGMMLLMAGQLSTATQIRSFIEGFN